MLQPSFTPSQFDTRVITTNDAVPTGIWSFTVPAHTIIQPVAMLLVYSADANAADRYLFMNAGKVGSYAIQSASAIAQVASTNRAYAINRVENPAVEIATLEAIYFPMPDDIYLSEAEKFIIDVVGAQVGDSILSAALRYRQWIVE